MNKIIITKGAWFTIIWPFKYNGISGANDNINTNGQWQKGLDILKGWEK